MKRAALASLILLLLLRLKQCHCVVRAEADLAPGPQPRGGVSVHQRHGLNLSRGSFPKGFIFGTATSAYQVEGMAGKDGRGPSIWDVFIRKPGVIADNGTADVSVDEYHRYKEDVNLMHNLNFDAYRFSISWSRIFPQGRGKVNWKGVAYYNRLIDYLIKKGEISQFDSLIDLFNNLTNCVGLSRKDYAHFAEFCFKTFGDRVKNWMTFNEPRVVAALGYDNGVFAPGRCSKPYGNCTQGNSGTEPYIVTHHLILCHAEAVKRYRQKYQTSRPPKEQGTSMWDGNNVNHDLCQTPEESFIHPIIYGEYPKSMQQIVKERLPKFTEEEVKIVKGSIDYVGINQYTTYYMYDNHQQTGEVPGYQNDWHAVERNGVPIGPRAYSKWLCIVPWGMYKAVTYIKEHYGNPTIFISESAVWVSTATAGMDDPGNVSIPVGRHDTRRIRFYSRYLRQLKRAMDDGANVIGFFAWSLLDNFEWLSGYTSRFGIVYVDYHSLKRYPKMSAYWFKKMLRRNKH
ncbi:Beta-glucosidase 44 [Asimina triloba]